MRTLKLAVPAAILFGGFLFCTTASYGTPAFAKKTGKTCTYCHVKVGKKDLNATGKCYQEKKSLDTCPAPQK